LQKATVKLINSFFANRNFHAKVGNIFSAVRDIEAGVPQDSVRNLHCRHSETRPNKNRAVCRRHCNSHALLVARSNYGTASGGCEESGDMVSPLANPDKSSAILFTRRRVHRPVGEIVMFDQPIPWKNEVRYLGISFDNYLRFNDQLEHAKTSGQMVRGQLNSLVNLRSGGTCPTRNSRSCRSCRINFFERLSTPRGSSGILNSIEKRTPQPTKNSCRMMHGNAMRKRLYSPGTAAT
jgi:hypothetical protein